MAKRLQEYIKYTTKELEQYAQADGSCVRKINTNLHLCLEPYCLDDFKNVLLTQLMRTKVGLYDVRLDGIVLDIKNIKVLGTTGAIRFDDPAIHVNINADVYIFKPEAGAELTGVVKYIGPLQVGVILYRVFNVNLRVAQKLDKTEIKMDQSVKFRIRKYNLQNIFPYIDGELLLPEMEPHPAKEKKIIFNQDDNVDSGIEEKDGAQELGDLLATIKTEVPSEYEEAVENHKTKKSKKVKLGTIDPFFAKVQKERKSSFSLVEESLKDSSAPNIKRELSFTDDPISCTPKKVKKEEAESSTKKHKSKKIKNENKNDGL